MKVTGYTKVLGIFGYPVKHTLSPLIQNAAIEALGLPYVYIPFEVSPENLRSAINGIKSLGIVGVNITLPHKEKVIPFLDEITEEASLIGSINTIENNNDRLIGHNTDSKGYIRSLREDAGFDPKGKKALIIGAGGAARGVIAGLSLNRIAEIFIANRTLEKGEALAAEFRGKFKEVKFSAHPLSALNDPVILSSLDLIVNATSLSLEDRTIGVELSFTPPHVLISDIAYKPPITSFLKQAQEAGRKTLDGLGMLLYQGAISFEIWTSSKAPIDVMKKALMETVK